MQHPCRPHREVDGVLTSMIGENDRFILVQTPENAQQHTYAELHETRSRRATSGGSALREPFCGMRSRILPPGPPGARQATTIRIPHILRSSPASQPRHGTPSNPTSARSWQFNFL
jgi:hypothetical protein